MLELLSAKSAGNDEHLDAALFQSLSSQMQLHVSLVSVISRKPEVHHIISQWHPDFKLNLGKLIIIKSPYGVMLILSLFLQQ